jgi:hypothetical protein
MNADETALLRVLLQGRLEDDVVDFAAALGTAPHPEGGLLLVGTPAEEPWHFAAHLTDEAQWCHRPELAPTLVRWQVPESAPAHLAVSLDRIERVARQETLLVVSPDGAPEQLLERVADARRRGALVLAMESGDRELRGLANEALTVPDQATSGAPYLDVVQHVVSQTAGSATRRARTVRSRLGLILDRLQGIR